MDPGFRRGDGGKTFSEVAYSEGRMRKSGFGNGSNV